MRRAPAPAGSIRDWARRARVELAALPDSPRGLGSARAQAGDLAALADLIQTAGVAYLRTLAVVDAEDACTRAGVGSTAVMLRDVCGVPARQARADLHLAQRLFTTAAEGGGLPQLG